MVEYDTLSGQALKRHNEFTMSYYPQDLKGRNIHSEALTPLAIQRKGLPLQSNPPLTNHIK